MRGGLALALGLVAAVGAAWPAPAHAQNPTASADRPAEAGANVIVLGSKTDAEMAELFGAISDHVAGSEVDPDLTEVPADTTRARFAVVLSEQSDLRAVFWILREPGEGYRVFVYEPRRQAYLLRGVPIAAGEDAAAVEMAAVIVGTMAQAMVAGEVLDLQEATEAELAEAERVLDEREGTPERAKPPEPPPPDDPVAVPENPVIDDPPPDPERPRPDLWFSLGYAGEAVAEQLPWASGPGLRLGVGVHRLAAVEATYDVAPGASVSDNVDASVRFDRHRVTISAGPRFAVGKRVELAIPLGPELELFDWRVGDQRGLRAVGRAGAAFHTRIRLVQGLRLEIGVSGAVVLNTFDFVVCRDGGFECDGENRRTVLSPYRGRGSVYAGVGYVF